MKRTIIEASQLELNDKVVAIKRVSKTVKGGRTMRFSALVVVGDGNGHVGVGTGKAGEVPEAIRKGKEAAVKNLVEIPIDENKSIPHDFIGKFGSASVLVQGHYQSFLGSALGDFLEIRTGHMSSGRCISIILLNSHDI